ncbi:hypothetical protein CS546_01980 [Porphyromonas gingivalis]|nr:hypothetical protein CS546_01980 [Porphyromonas gingivalis]ATR97062.1 hypothetical protein CS548_08365 [Porphyromonas gingivalis]
MVSHERILWSPMRGYYGLTREDTMVSYERILWSHIRGYYGLLMEDTICSVADGKFGGWNVR